MASAICPSCSTENPEGMKFCGQCATPLLNWCPSCGFENPPGFKFCGDCSTSLSGDSDAPVTPSGSEIAAPSPNEDPKEIAMEVAREWTRSGIDQVSRMLGLAVTQGTPMLEKVASSLIENQIKQKVEWTFSDPEDLAEGRCRVVANASAPLEVGLLTFKWRSTASADFELSIDTAERRLLEWKMVPQSFKAVSSEEANELRDRVGDEVEKVKEKFRGFFKT